MRLVAAAGRADNISAEDAMSKEPWHLELDDAALLSQCDVHTYRSSGPGGQHRNKVSSAVRLRHRPTGITAHGDDSRSQHENKALAIKRLRMNFALQLRRPMDKIAGEAPAVLRECLFMPRVGRSAGDLAGLPAAGARKRLQIGRKDHRFWPVAAALLDILEAFEGRIADAAAWLGITTSNLVSTFQDDRHLLAAAQAIRKKHGLGAIK
jgi:hypothetical protein